MNGLDFFFSPSATGDDDDWGEFVDSLSPNPNGFFADRHGSDSAPNRIDSEKKCQVPWVTSRGPVPLSVFGEEEEDESGAPVTSFKFSFDSFSSKHNDGIGSVNTNNPTVGISGLIQNLYRDNGQNEPENNLSHLETNGNDKESLSSRKIENSAVSLETLNWNPLNLDTKKTSNVVSSSTIGVTLEPNYSDLSFVDKNDDDVDDGWEFKTAESMFQTADGGHKVKNHMPFLTMLYKSSEETVFVS